MPRRSEQGSIAPGAVGGAGRSAQLSKCTQWGEPATGIVGELLSSTTTWWEHCAHRPLPMGPLSTTLATTTMAAGEPGGGGGEVGGGVSVEGDSSAVAGGVTGRSSARAAAGGAGWLQA